MDPRIGTWCGKYQLETRLGSGAFGVVYQAQHPQLGQPRAIKILNVNGIDPDNADRLLREAKLAASLHHANVVQIYDVDVHEGAPYVVMELLEGQSLRQVIGAAPNGLPFSRAAHLLDQLAAALDYAHQRGVVHRDVKPDNAFVGPEEQLKVVDFGLGRARDEGGNSSYGPVGTILYAAPELLTLWDKEDHFKLGVSADGYALGIVAYELLTGRVPFRGSIESILNAHAHLSPPSPRRLRPDLPPEAERVLMRQLAKAPAQRYPSAEAFVAALRSALGAAKLRPPTRVSWQALGVVGAALLLIWILSGMPLCIGCGSDTPTPESTVDATAAPEPSATPALPITRPIATFPVFAQSTPTAASAGTQDCIRVSEAPVRTDTNGRVTQSLTVTNGCVSALNVLVNATESNRQTGLAVDAPTFQIQDLKPDAHYTVTFPLAAGESLASWPTTWFDPLHSGLTDSVCWDVTVDGQARCLKIDPWLGDTLYALNQSATGRALIASAARAGLRIQQGAPIGNAMGEYDALTRSIVLDTGLTAAKNGAEATSSWERAAILAHELQRALGGSSSSAGLQCATAQASAFDAEGKVWRDFWPKGPPPNLDALHTQLNQVATSFDGGSPSNLAQFVASLRFKYGDECASSP